MELLVLRLVHVLGGIFWVGSGVFASFFLMPALAGVGPAAGAVMGGLQQRRLFVFMPTVAVLTILAGLRLMWLTSGGFAPAYFSSPQGSAYALGGAASIVAFLLALLIGRPSGVRIGALSAQLAATTDDASRTRTVAELDRVRLRSGIVGWVTTWLLIFSAAAMAVARYMA